VHFAPLDGNDFGVLIHKIYHDCEKCDLCEIYLIKLPTTHFFLDFNESPLDVIL
jgi:hypothetical protein